MRRIGCEQMCQFMLITYIRIEPEVACSGQENGGHAIMDRSHDFVRLCGNNGATEDLLAIRTFPVIPEAREGERFLVLERNIPGGLRTMVLLPFVKAVGNYQAAFGKQ